MRVVRLGFDGVAEWTETECVRVRGRPALVVRDQAEVAVGPLGKCQACRFFAEDIADPSNTQLLPKLAPGGDGGRRPGEVADVQPVEAIRIACVCSLASENEVGSILGSDHRDKPILPDQGGIVARPQLEPLRVQDRHIRVEQREAEPDSLDLDRDPIPFLRLDGVIINVFIIRHAVDGHIHVDRLRPGEIVVRLDLGHVLEHSHAEGPQRADPCRGAEPEIMQAQRRLGADLEGRGHLAVLARLDFRDRDARLIEQDLPGIAQPLAGQDHRDLGAALGTHWLQSSDRGAGRHCQCRRGDDRQCEQGGKDLFHISEVGRRAKEGVVIARSRRWSHRPDLESDREDRIISRQVDIAPRNLPAMLNSYWTRSSRRRPVETEFFQKGGTWSISDLGVRTPVSVTAAPSVRFHPSPGSGSDGCRSSWGHGKSR